MRVVLIDDEPLAHVALRALLDRHPDVEVVGEALSGQDAIAWITKLAPDLVFLDIRMPGISGFDVLRAAPPEHRPLVILATAYEEYALDAFDAAAFDYLTKPISAARLAETLRRARTALRTEHATRVAVRMGARSLVVGVDDIDWIASNGYCSTLHARNGQYVVRETLASLGHRLDPLQFVRVHRRAIVNVRRIAELRHGASGVLAVLLVDGTRLVVSRRRRAAVARLLNPG